LKQGLALLCVGFGGGRGVGQSGVVRGQAGAVQFAQ
jgi:hypothetical protein